MMFDLKTVVSAVRTFTKTNSPAILTGIGVSGTVATAYFAGVASYKAANRLGEESPYLSNKEKVLEVWDLYIPAAISGVVTIGCIIGANHISSHKTAAAYSVLAVTEKAFEEYRTKVIERVGETKEQAIRDEVAQARISENPPGGNLVVVHPEGVICCELMTGRYFVGDMEKLRQAVNEVNAKLLREDYVVIGEFYYILGLQQTSSAGRLGWTSDKLLELEFSTTLTEDNKPCLAFDYNYVKPM